MVCQKCGFQNPDNAKCCCGCGKKLVEKPKKNNAWVPIVAVVVLTGIIIAAIMLAIPEKKEGWYVNEDGSHSYYIDNKMATGMHEIEGEKYFFDDQGIMHEGFLHLNEELYFFNNDGVMQTGFVQMETEAFKAVLADVENDWITSEIKATYYFDADGKAVSGWQTLDGNKYFFEEDCKMVVGWKQIGEDYYYFREDGTMITGEAKLDSSREAFFDEDGRYEYCLKTERPEQSLVGKAKFTDSHGKSSVYYVLLNEPAKDCVYMTGTVELTGSNYTKSDGEWGVYILDEYGRWRRQGFFNMDGRQGRFSIDLGGKETFYAVACARHGASYSTYFKTTVDSITYHYDVK